jgi:L-threonylcarbamoyladenylate synthase
MSNFLYLSDEQQIASNLLRGDTILYPTDTIWGLGCDATNVEAIQNVYQLKNRPLDKKFILLFSDVNMLSQYCDLSIEILASLFNPLNKPTTYILASKFKLPSILSQDGFWAVRIPNNTFCKNLIHQLGRPLVSSSANLSGAPNPNSFLEIDKKIKEHVDMIVNPDLDSGTGNASQILKWMDGKIEVIRP